jgi:hypothetical protein
MKNYILNELACIRATEPIGSDRYNELSKAIRWMYEQTPQSKEKEKEQESESQVSKYAHTKIKWNEDGREEDAIIAINCLYNEKYDDEIVFYCEDEEDFERLKEYNNGEDFVVVGCTLFTEDIY